VIITSHGLVKVLDLETRATLGRLTPADRRASDVTGLGALLYASLTGRWPLGAGRGLPPAEVDPSGARRSPRQLRAGVPRELDALAMAALGTSDQPQLNAPEMVDALELIAADLPTGSQPALDDDPEADTPAAQSAKAAQAERLARATALRRRTLRRRVLPVALLVLLALAAWLVGVAVGRLPGHSGGKASLGGSSPAKPAGTALKLNTVSDFDPLGDTVENPTQVHLAYDGDAATAWHTEQYNGSQWGGNPAKTGVGLKVDLGRAVTVSKVQLLFTQAGVSVELRYNDQDSASLDSYTVAATSPRTHEASQLLTPPSVGAHRYWLIWLTALPETAPNAKTYEAQLAEMKFFG
jgi:putative peptidoglycan lipid II flippase